MPGSDGSVLYYVRDINNVSDYVSPTVGYSFAWSSQYAVLILGGYLYVVELLMVVCLSYCYHPSMQFLKRCCHNLTVC